MLPDSIGHEIYNLASRLFPICRSITGDGVRETLAVLKKVCPDMKVYEVPSGTKVFDWTVPKEWNVRDAFVVCPDGAKIAEFKKNNLHLMSYSIPADKTMSLDELQEHLYSLPEQPDVIPYVTSYYKERFGFCLRHDERMKLKRGDYRVFVDTELKYGSMSYGEIIIPGQSEEEVFFSSNICHPSMANNELSAPCLAVYLARWLLSLPRRLTYRMIFIPETIGAIAYLSSNVDELKERVIAGFNLTCVGGPGNFSLIASRYGNTLADRAAKSVLGDVAPDYKSYSFLDRCSDERQYNAPGVELPVCCLTRSKFDEYPEYHTSADNMDFITAGGLCASFELCCRIVEALEANRRYKVKFLCEPQLSPRGLYPSVSEKNTWSNVQDMLNFIAYCDGRNDIFEISEITGVPVSKIIAVADRLVAADVIEG